EEAKRILENSIKTEKISHSYMFIGQNGIGKFMIAKEFAKAILCKGEQKPCNICEACIKFNGENNPDIQIIDETEEKSIKTETIKEMVKGVYEKPIGGSRKVYIINDSQKMTKEAQNSLLKTLEEPPEYVVIILITENENLLLNTIKSRCTKIKFNPLKDNEVIKILKEKYGYEEVPENILEVAGGSATHALSVQGKEEIFNEIKTIFSNLEKINIIDLLNKKDLIFKDKDSIYEILDYINIILFNKIKENIQYTNCIKIVEETKDRLKKNSNYDMTIDNLLLKIWEGING
ncbi:MAG: DNA polymerase III subunit delta', partial [Clostridia bacterium]